MSLPADTLVTSMFRAPAPLDRWSTAQVPLKRGSLLYCEVTRIGCYDTMDTLGTGDEPIAPGTRIVCVAGVRESSTSMSGRAPIGLQQPGEQLDLLAAGGIVGRHTYLASGSAPPTQVAYLGAVVGPDGGPIVLGDRTGGEAHLGTAPLIMVLGTAAEVGKTRTTRLVIESLGLAGLTVAACKLKGTGRRRDLREYQRAGASKVVDFVDAGLESTYAQPPAVVASAARRAISEASIDAQVVVAELGGDLISGGGIEILTDPQIHQSLRLTVLVGSDIFSILGATDWLRGLAWPGPISYGPMRRNNGVCSSLLIELGHSPLVLDQAGIVGALVDSGVLAGPPLETLQPVMTTSDAIRRD